MLLPLAACAGHNQFSNAGLDRARALREGPPLPLDQVLVLQMAGVGPTDTTVTFAAAAGRTVVMRHLPPDNAVFAIIQVPPDSGANGQVTLRAHPLPGRIGVHLEATPRWPKGTRITFSYAIHFLAPEGINEHYLGTSFYASALGIGQLLDNGKFDFIPTTHPAADMLNAAIAAPGDYLVAAPR